MSEHKNKSVQTAIINLCDALCSWERSTGLQSVLILREQYGFEYRAVNGKPVIQTDLSDSRLMGILKG